MKKIIAQTPVGTIVVDDIRFDTSIERKRVIIYRRSSGYSYAMLCKLANNKYAFVSMEDMESRPTYEGTTPIESMAKVIVAGRDIRLFNDMDEFVRARKCSSF